MIDLGWSRKLPGAALVRKRNSETDFRARICLYRLSMTVGHRWRSYFVIQISLSFTQATPSVQVRGGLLRPDFDETAPQSQNVVNNQIAIVVFV